MNTDVYVYKEISIILYPISKYTRKELTPRKSLLGRPQKGPEEGGKGHGVLGRPQKGPGKCSAHGLVAGGVNALRVYRYWI